MAIRLHAWLNDKFEEQLLVGNHWLREQNRARAHGHGTRRRDWRGLYHDNGSCLDIASLFPSASASARHSALQVLRLNPLTLTDGQSQVVAHLDPACVRHLAQQAPHLSRLPAQAVLAVRAYTIRYTSYGPPRHRLRLILHAVDWIGTSTETVRGAVPLHQVDEVSTVLRQLDHTRAIEDRRCLRPNPETAIATGIGDEGEEGQGGEGEGGGGGGVGDEAGDEEEGEGEGEEEHIMAPAMEKPTDPSPTQQPYTQANFATQMSTTGGELQVLGVNRLEPVMAGNTQREELRKAPANPDCQGVLELLKKVGLVQPPAPAPAVQWNFQQQPKSASTQASPRTPSHPSGTTTPQQSPSVCKNQTPKTPSLAPPRRKKPATEVEARSPVIAKSPETPQVNDEPSDRDDCSDTSMECNWMKGFVFNSESVVPDHWQRLVLGNKESWYKTQPGVIPFPEHNMPIRWFSKICAIADENAAAQEQTQSDDEEAVEPSPDSDPEEGEAASSSESEAKVPQNAEPRTSQISWSASPSPEPPQRPAIIKRGLPPDSSLDTGEPMEHTKITRVLPAVIISPSKEKESSAPPSSPPVLPVVEIPADSDEEMEMETSVPQALGEDTTRDAHVVSSRRKVGGSQSTKHKPIVQVRETPCAKSRRIHLSPRGREQAPSQETKNSSSMSIVLGTYDDPALVTPAKETRDQTVITNNAIVEREVIDLSSGEEQAHVDQTESAVASSRSSEDVPMPDSPSHTEEQAKKVDRANVSGHNVQPPQDANHKSISGSTKRKFAASPTTSSRRQSKRREIKIVGFGNDLPPTIDPTLAMRKDRADSLQRFREARKSSTSFESRSGSVGKTDTDKISEAMDIDAKCNPRVMSPRHQSLYEEPSLPRTLPKSEQWPITSPRPPLAVAQSQIPATGGSPSRQSVQHTCAKVDEPVLLVTEPSTIFDKFRAAYPEYVADRKHFKGMCAQMYRLEEEDKMVPKWQWDDFIIRNRTDYWTYLCECGDTGGSPEPYHRFYKDTIRGTLHKKEIVDSKRKLLQALEELGAEPPAPLVEEPRPSRTSLPNAFSQHKCPPAHRTPESLRQPPPHSLPSHSHTNQHTSIPSSHTSAIRPPVFPASARIPTSDRSVPKPPAPNPNLLSRLSLDPTPRISRTPETTGDPFRDYYFAAQRAKSLTGSGTVDRSKPWPQSLEGRPTVADAPRRKVDVLSWKDVL